MAESRSGSGLVWLIVALVALPTFLVIALVCGGAAMGFFTYRQARDDLQEEMRRVEVQERQARDQAEAEARAREEEARRAAEAAAGAGAP